MNIDRHYKLTQRQQFYLVLLSIVKHYIDTAINLQIKNRWINTFEYIQKRYFDVVSELVLSYE